MDENLDLESSGLSSTPDAGETIEPSSESARLREIVDEALVAERSVERHGCWRYLLSRPRAERLMQRHCGGERAWTFCQHQASPEADR